MVGPIGATSSLLSRRGLLASGSAVAIAGFGRRAVASAPIRFGLPPVVLDSVELLQTDFRAILVQRLGQPVELVQRRSYQEIMTLLLSGQLHAAWICGYPYVQFADRLSLLAVPVYHGTSLYQSYPIANRARQAHALEDLRGNVHAISYPDSDSGHLVTRYQQARLGETPATFFREIVFTYGHRNVVRAMAAGLADRSSAEGYVWDVFSEIEPALTDACQVVSRRRPAASGAGRLLRVLQERRFTPVGGERTRTFEARVVAATHADLDAMVREGQFREDLLFRINVIPMHIPPLRDRGEDVTALLRHRRLRKPGRADLSGLDDRLRDPRRIPGPQQAWPRRLHLRVARHADYSGARKQADRARERRAHLRRPSGQAANAFALPAPLSAGDRVLMTDNVYPPMRAFAERDLPRLGIETVFFDPMALDGLAAELAKGARVVWCESPGSATMEVSDLPRIIEMAHAAGALVACDNTWATPLNLKPLELGADIVTEALTKYIAGHSDVLLGSITVRDDELVRTIWSMFGRFGTGVSPDEASLALRGMETMAVRLAHSARIALGLATWLADQPVVERVLYPPLPGSPGHEVWRRDFRGASALFSVVFRRGLAEHVHRALESLSTFSIGASWGGTHSLVAPMPVTPYRSVTQWPHDDLVLRFSIGVEAEEDLREDVERILARLTASSNPPSPA